MSNYWDRLEPNSTDETLIEGLQARVADPFWFLARQWQTGEFDGEDAASPISVEIDTQSANLTTLSTPDGKRQSLRDSVVPLEALIEAVPPNTRSAEDVASLANAALQGLAMRKADTAEIRGILRKLYPFKAAAYQPEHPLPQAAQRRLRLLERHSFDPFALYRDKGDKAAKALKGISDLKGWLAEVIALCDARGRGIAGRTDAWQEHDLSYGATIGTTVGEDRYELKLANYGGGRLDWYSFDFAKGAGGAPTRSKITTTKAMLYPTPLTYAGQPVPRFWEFEDAAVHFGGISAGPGDTARMVVADFAAIGGDDMFVVPVEAQVGTVTRVSRMIVRDTFGKWHSIPSAQYTDTPARAGTRPEFALFQMTGRPRGDTHVSDWLPILPVTANAMNGKPLERISMRRDEEANLAWAVEEEIEGAFGRAMRRRQAWEIEEPAQMDQQKQAWPYKLQSAVPPWWIPLVPERIGKGAEIQLRRARLGAWDVLPPNKAGPKSMLLDPTRPVTFAEAALPASSLRITRHWQIARGYDGKPILWQSWHRRNGAEDRASGLEYDAIRKKW